jgi:NAD(P)-dependent dehydrogenase (short-subunit alcohol dehydrogenase family)
VNDLGVELDGSGRTSEPAMAVTEEIAALGGEAVADGNDVSDWDGARSLVETALERFGGLHVVVNNAGVLRDKMLVNMSVDEWDAVIRVHLRGSFCVTRWAASYWRDRAKQGAADGGRVINTTSPAGLYGNPGQANYVTAKAGLAAFTITTAAELQRYGVMVNAVSPGARTRMTEHLGVPFLEKPSSPEAFDVGSPANVAPLVVWLGSEEAAGITGRVFNISGGRISIGEGWREGPNAKKRGARWEVDELGPVLQEIVSQAAPNFNPFVGTS